jgi:hypothetical protein
MHKAIARNLYSKDRERTAARQHIRAGQTWPDVENHLRPEQVPYSGARHRPIGHPQPPLARNAHRGAERVRLRSDPQGLALHGAYPRH